MTETKSRTTNRDKLASHLRQMEYWQGLIDDIETQAMNRAGDVYILKVLLRDNLEYNRAVSQRNGHQLAANTYALAVIAGVEQQ